MGCADFEQSERMSRNVGSYTGQKHPRSRQRHGRTNGHPDLTPAHVRGSGNPNPSLPRGPGEQQRPQRGSWQYSTGSVGGRAGQPMDSRTSGRDPFSEGDMDEAAAADAVTDGSTRPTGERTWQRYIARFLVISLFVWNGNELLATVTTLVRVIAF